MRAKPMPKSNQLKTAKPSAKSLVKDTRRQTRARPLSEEKIRIVLEGLRGEESIAEICRRESEED